MKEMLKTIGVGFLISLFIMSIIEMTKDKPTKYICNTDGCYVASDYGTSINCVYFDGVYHENKQSLKENPKNGVEVVMCGSYTIHNLEDII